ncbi:hypothetical protein SOCE26_052580 [Sorangium cellulosum]|uniref:DUF4190 domain-containing protein n=1 Tax=Sorangium cellulosum TaxID=56 RepID=A0A2L0EWX9_SORCE|nr:DUF4190 domain-containing protein [Sorangium cellulosum]AUX43803.1 hypothetical protein SOCE26_052580 [Sorangium cellulosum]
MSHAFGPSQSPPNCDANEPVEAPVVVVHAAHAAREAAQSSEGAQRAVGAEPLSPQAPPLPPERRQLSTLAVSSIVAALLLGPLGAVTAIVFGWIARREIEQAPERRRGRALATVGLALGVLLTLGWSAAIGAGAWMWRMHLGGEVASGLAEGEASPEPASTGSPAAPLPDSLPPAAQPGGSVPPHTTHRRIGGLSIVDIGADVSALSEELAKQRAEAHAQGEKVLVMTTSDPCDPCRGVDRSLGDPLMQTALRSVRLVRVDIDLFKEDLDQIKMPRRLYPGFFLLSPDLTPQDGINGGEWDDDIARNIAPVLGAFVRGQYTTRRQPWHPLPGSGMRL